MFLSPPAWTVPLADLTQWFDWGAIGALGTVATLLMAVRLATRDSAERRVAKAAIIMAAIQPIAAVIKTIDGQWALGQKLGQAPEVVFQRLVKIEVLDEMRTSMFEIKPSELPTVRSIDAFIAARSALKNIKEEGLDLMRLDPNRLITWVPSRVGDLMRYHDALVEEALKFTSQKNLLAEMAPPEKTAVSGAPKP